MDSGSQLAEEGSYELCWASSDSLRAPACIIRRSWLQSSHTKVVRVERVADTTGCSREHYYPSARCVLRSAGGHVAEAWRIAAERAAQGRGAANRRERLAYPLCNHCGRQHAGDSSRDSVRADGFLHKPAV